MQQLNRVNSTTVANWHGQFELLAVNCTSDNSTGLKPNYRTLLLYFPIAFSV